MHAMAHYFGVTRRRLVAVLCVLVPLCIGSAARASVAWGRTPAAAGGAVTVTPCDQSPTREQADLAPGEQNMPSGDPETHVTRLADGRLRVRLYTAPVGIPCRTGWRWDNIDLGGPSSSGMVSPRNGISGLSLATTARAGGILATWLNGADLAFGVALDALDGIRPAPLQGHVASTTIRFPQIVPGADLTLRTSLYGYDLHVVLRDPRVSGQLDLTLMPDPRALIGQTAQGGIAVTHPEQGCGSSGCVAPDQQTDFVVGPALVQDSRPDLAATLGSGPLTIALAPATAPSDGSGRALPGVARQLRLRIDPRWLHDPRRVFPVLLDVPVSGGSVQAAATVASCTPTTPVLPMQLLVGKDGPKDAAGPCTYHGLIFFTPQLGGASSPVQSAMLNLYAPRGAGQTGIRAYPNRAAGTIGPLSVSPLTWRTAPLPLPEVTGIPQLRYAGHWLRWDITAAMRGWVATITVRTPVPDQKWRGRRRGA